MGSWWASTRRCSARARAKAAPAMSASASPFRATWSSRCWPKPNGRNRSAALFDLDQDPHPGANQRSSALARWAYAELPGRLAHRRGEVRAGRALVELDAVVDSVVGHGLAG